MNPDLPHAPFPSSRADAEATARRIEREGFVDEEIVASMVAAPLTRRSSAQPRDLALAADDTDFAGWNLPDSSPAPVRQSPFQVAPLPEIRRPAPPLAPRIITPLPRPAARRWWLAALAGVVSVLCAAAAAVVVALSQNKLPPFGSPAPQPPVRGSAPQPAAAPAPW